MLMSGSLNHSFKRLVQHLIHLEKKSDCIYERIVESLTQMVHLKTDCISPHETVGAFGLLRY